jgi:hypothetical protein
MEKEKKYIIQISLLVGLMIFPLAANADEKRDNGNYEATFKATLPICTEYFFPNSMARPANFDLENTKENLSLT